MRLVKLARLLGVIHGGRALTAGAGAALALAACGGPSAEQSSETARVQTPPLGSEAQTAVEPETPETRPAAADRTEPDGARAAASSGYWGVAPGEPLPVNWEDLMPEGYEEDLLSEQQAFYEELERRYMANTTTLADAADYQGIEEGSALDYMPQLGGFDVVEDLDGQLIRIPGYVVPFELEGGRRQETFLFVPYMGACIHTPPPPPNQIIFVRADPAVQVDDIWTPYWIEGELRAEERRNDLGDAAYSLSLDEIEPYFSR